MKRLIYFSGLALAGITMALADNGNLALSPRAQSQVARIVPAEKMAKAEKGDSCCSPHAVALSPRAASQQQWTVAPKSNDPDLAHISSSLSPRAQAQADHVGKRFEVAPVK
jgi:hypothetical protein